MHLKPIRMNWLMSKPVEWTALVLTAPFIGFILALVWIAEKLDPPRRWHRWYAWRPVSCGRWPEDGFKGSVWLESVWRARDAYGRILHQREEPTDDERERIKRW